MNLSEELMLSIAAAQLNPVRVKVLPDGRVAHVNVLTFMRARLSVGPAGKQYYNDEWWYETIQGAVSALEAWEGEGEPDGWMRHPKTGRRRPEGDPDREYINE